MHEIRYRAIHDVSIHAPHEGERRKSIVKYVSGRTFQSTLPTRGSDLLPVFKRDRDIIVSIHAPHEGERHCSPLRLLV